MVLASFHVRDVFLSVTQERFTLVHTKEGTKCCSHLRFGGRFFQANMLGVLFWDRAITNCLTPKPAFEEREPCDDSCW